MARLTFVIVSVLVVEAACWFWKQPVQAEAACTDDKNYGTTCKAWKQYCTNLNFKWEDGEVFWGHCKKTCNKCDGDNSSEDNNACVDAYGSNCDGNEGFCENGNWGDGTAFWKYCKKTCNCCDGSCDAKQAEKDKEDAAEDVACGAKTNNGPSASAFKSDILNYHNKLRNKHQNTPSMSWDNTLQNYAQKHCNAIVAQNIGLWHSTSADRGGSGENLAMRMIGGKVCSNVGGQSTQAWYDEIEFYDFSTGKNKPGTNDAIGHFTQLVWSSSTKLGCAYSVNSNGYAYVCCNYDPPGNYIGQYLSKVKPLKSKKAMLVQKRQTSEKRE